MKKQNHTHKKRMKEVWIAIRSHIKLWGLIVRHSKGAPDSTRRNGAIWNVLQTYLVEPQSSKGVKDHIFKI